MTFLSIIGRINLFFLGSKGILPEETGGPLHCRKMEKHMPLSVPVLVGAFVRPTTENLTNYAEAVKKAAILFPFPKRDDTGQMVEFPGSKAIQSVAVRQTHKMISGMHSSAILK